MKSTSDDNSCDCPACAMLHAFYGWCDSHGQSIVPERLLGALAPLLSRSLVSLKEAGATNHQIMLAFDGFMHLFGTIAQQAGLPFAIMGGPMASTSAPPADHGGFSRRDT